MTTTVNLFDIAYIELHDDITPFPFDNMGADETFGVMTLSVPKVEITQQPLFLFFTIDVTGSMSERETFGGSKKIDYVIQTFKNMMIYLSKLSTSVHICVNTFNDKVNVLIEPTELREELVLKELIQKMENLETNGSTNIELALNSANERLESYAETYPEHQIVHLFMTDGEATEGDKNPDRLSKLLNTRFHNIFVGYGLQHNVQLLRMLGEQPRSEYQFVDNMENTTLVYGESIHQFLYPALQHVEICIHNGTIYNWKTDSWSDSIHESLFVGDTNKKYHIRTRTPYGVYATVSAIPVSTQKSSVDVVHVLPPLLAESGDVLGTDLTKYMYRQRVQELLAPIKTNDVYNNNMNYKKELRNVFRQMRQYMRQNELLEDPFMKTLCDDLVVVYSTMDRKYGLMYSVARQTSQGRQQTYNISTPVRVDSRSDTLFPPPPPILRRLKTESQQPDTEYIDNMELFLKEKNARGLSLIHPDVLDCLESDQFDEIMARNKKNDEDDIENYKTNPADKFTCYATPTVLNTVQAMSSQSESLF
jgi:uncharacterized protein YegL